MPSLDNLLGEESARRFAEQIKTPQEALVNAMQGEVHRLQLHLASLHLKLANDDLDLYDQLVDQVLAHFESMQSMAAERGDHLQSRLLREVITRTENIVQTLRARRAVRTAQMQESEDACPKTNPSG